MSNTSEGPSRSPQALPEISIGQILGLVELLLNKEGGREDIYKLAAELSMELGETLGVIKAAEMLGLVHTPGGDVVVESFGTKVIDGSINERKELIGEKLEKLPLFKALRDYLKTQDGEVTREEALEKLAELLPNEDAEASFTTLVNWGRYAELFGYNDDTQTFYLDTGEPREE